MPRAENKLTVNQFIKGLITDETELNQSAGGSLDENNFEITRKGNRKRRLGIDFETSNSTFNVSTTTTVGTEAFNQFRWEAAGSDGRATFIVIQIGPTLHFYDASKEPLSGGKKSFTVNLDGATHRAPSFSTVGTDPVDMASGRGALFVTGKKVIPFAVEYDQDTDTISETVLPIKIRDFAKQDTVTANSSQLTFPSGGNDSYIYDLLNQGWFKTSVETSAGVQSTPILEAFGSSQGVFPGRNSAFHGGYIDTSSTATPNKEFSFNAYKQLFKGNSLAALGHYKLDAFERSMDRITQGAIDTSLSTLGNLTAESEKERPTAVAFFAGHVFWGFKNILFFGQLQQNEILAASRCLQEADPTSEEISEPVAIDGGEIPIPEMGNFVALFNMEQSLVLFADNGVWLLSGSDSSGFSAINFQLKRISSIGALSSRSVVDVEGLPVWWGENGIYTLVSSEDKTSFAVQDLTLDKIEDFYADISSLSKLNATGNYDPVARQVLYLYTTTGSAAVDRFRYDNILKFDIKYQAFIPHEVSISDSADPYMIGVVNGPQITQGSATEVVQADGVDVTANSVTVTSGVATAVGNSNTVKYMVVDPPSSGTNVPLTFAEFNNTTYLDWTDNDYATNSYLETFEHLNDDPMTWMQTPWVYVYAKQTETVVDAAPDNISCTLTHNSGYISDTTAADLGGSTFTAGGDNSTGFIKGEDGGLYYLVTSDHGSGGSRIELQLIDVSDGTLTFSRTRTQFDDDATTSGLDPGSIYNFSSLGALGFAAIPNSPYFIMWGFAAPGGAQRNYAFVYYKVNSAGAVVIHGGYAARSDSLNFANDTLAVQGVGRWGEGTDDDYILIAFNHTDGPDAEPWITRLPSINDSTDFTVSDVASSLNADSLDLNAATGDWDDNFWAAHTTRNLVHRQKVFFLPKQNTLGGTIWTTHLFTYKDGDSMQFHIDNPGNAANSTFLESVDTTYPNGAMFRAELQENVSTTFMEVVATTVDNANWIDESDVAQIPFDDEREDKNGVSDDNQDGYMAPSVQRGTTGAQDDVYLMGFPKVFYNETPDLTPTGSFLKARMFTWNQVTAVATERDTAEGDTFDPVADMGLSEGNRFDNNPRMACMYIDETAAKMKVINNFRAAADTLGDRFVVSEFADVSCTAGGGGGSSEAFVIQNQSDLTMQARWDWADSSASNKFGTAQTAYKYRQLQLVDDVGVVAHDGGYKITVTRLKVRGKGRALRLRFQAVTGKGIELVGWALWLGKNVRP